VKTFDQLVVNFLQSKHGDLFDVTPVPDNWFGKLSGEIVFEQRARQVNEAPPILEPVDIRAKQMLARSHKIEEPRERIILQHLRIERVPLQEVHYKHAGVDRELWICGNEKEVFAPKAPWNRGRVTGAIAGVILVAAGLLALLVFFLK
jgi:hypothetical protein